MKETDSTENKQVPSDIELMEIVTLLWSKRKLIAIITGAFTFIGIIYAFFIATPMFKSTLTLYPTNQEQDRTSKLKSVAAQFGIGGLNNSSNDYNIMDVVMSTTISKMIIQHRWKSRDYEKPVLLTDFWDIKGDNDYIRMMKAINQMKEQISTSMNDESGLIYISVLSREPQLSADIVNFVGSEVQKYVQERQRTEGRRNREFIEKRMKLAQNELESVEEILELFLTKNFKISESPALQIKLGRLKRNVEIKQEVYLSLHKQLEFALIEEVRNAPVVNILDHGEKPIKKSKPKRLFIIIAFLFTSLVLTILAIFVLEIFNRNRINHYGLQVHSFDDD